MVRGFHRGRGAVVAVTVLLRCGYMWTGYHWRNLPLACGGCLAAWVLRLEGELKDPDEHFPYLMDDIVVCKQKQSRSK
jgi:hypothetical protein